MALASPNLLPDRPTVAVVGAGLGGLAAALHLAAQGWRVTVYEQTEAVGGKCGRVSWEGYHFDTGPSVLTLPFLLDELFAATGARREDYVELVPVEPGCRYFWPDGTVFDAPGTLPAFRAAVAQHFPAEVAGFDRFAAYLARLWQVSEPVFLRRPLTLANLLKVDWRLAPAALALARPGSLHGTVRAFFRDPRLIQLFDRFATYNGSDPYRTPSAFNVIAQAELGFGAWGVRGGLYGLVQGLARRAAELGVEVRLKTPVVALTFDERGRATGIVTGGLATTYDAVVVNADALSARAGPLCAGHPRARTWRQAARRVEVSGSGFVLLQAMARPEPRLAVHNVFFSDDYPREFREQFGRPSRPLDNPTLYVSVPAKYDASLAPPGAEGWFVLVNAPPLDRCPQWPARYGEHLQTLLRQRGLMPGGEQPRWTLTRTPRFFADHLGAWQGSLYGASSNHLLAAFARVPQKTAGAPGLFFCGGGAHPGGGIPLVLLSGRMAAEAVAQAARRRR